MFAYWRSLPLHTEVLAVSWQSLSARKENQELAIHHKGGKEGWENYIELYE